MFGLFASVNWWADFAKTLGLKSVSLRSGSFGPGSDGQGREAGFSGHEGRPPPVHQGMVQPKPAAILGLNTPFIRGRKKHWK